MLSQALLGAALLASAVNASPYYPRRCVLEAINPITTYFVQSEQSTTWTSVVVTSTKLFETITYMINNATIDTIITETHTFYGNKTIVGNGTAPTAPYASITHTTPSFTFEPVAGQTITLAAGPTYVAYLDFYGGLDEPYESTSTDEYSTLPFTTAPPAEATCDNLVDYLNVLPTNAEDYHYLIQTYSSGVPAYESGALLSIPASMIDYLRHDSAIVDAYGSKDIATCSLRPTATYTTLPVYTSVYMTPEPTSTFYKTPLKSGTTTPPWNTLVDPPHPPPPKPEHSSTPAYYPGFPETSQIPYESQPFEATTPTATYVSTTYESTSTHVTRAGCIRCSFPTDNPIPNPTPTGKEQRPTADDFPLAPSIGMPSIQSPDVKPTDSPQGPQQHPNNPGNTITFGDNTVIIKPAQPTQPGGQGSAKPGDNDNNIIFGSRTLTPGQVITTDGYTISVPTGGHGSSLVVDGSTIPVNNNPGPTGPPVLTAGDKTITANSQGQFIIGSKTLTPGGPAVTDHGTTYSLGPSGSIAVVNGVTQSIGYGPAATGPPVLTMKDHEISATVIGGTTAFIVAPGQTLKPGGVLTVDGTTFSMPEDGHGSTIVVNGKSSTLSGTGLPVMTLSSDSVTASVIDGTTAFVLGPGQTLTPGGVLTVDGTTFSMPASASGSVVVINGVTSTLAFPQTTAAPALTINGKTYSATVRDGTTEYVLGKGTTLKPGEAVTISGTTFSLDEHGTALVINGKTSSIPRLPATNSASTTRSDSKSQSTSDSSSESQSTTGVRAPGNFIASGIGITSKEGAGSGRNSGLDKWAEGIVIGLAGWLMMLL
ncbi:hypothetical protein BDV96DRAFT_611832 [Lophiotrema nucula]|uniref:Uncharacterized protein n=1 Tax=Lophiotrema nucula TaxID=690887 RepID=A0A6A5ZDT7_9PLEO|nr:hypothetical protein BDV96DRAFT_611832 [Lophiotrema nucula]